MNPAAASWTPLRSTTLRNAASVTASIRSGINISTSTTSRIRAGQRFHSHHHSTTTTAPCTNSVRKTLYNSTNNGTHQSRLAALHPSSTVVRSPVSTQSRFAPVIRRGFADNAASKSISSSSPSSAGAGAVATPAKKSSGLMDKFKQMVKQYGYTGVAVYLGISMIDLAATFVVVKAMGMEKIEVAQDWVVDHIGGYFGYKRHDHEAKEKKDAVDLDKVDDEQVGAIYNKASGLWSVFVIAYGIHKLLVPLRVVATSMITPPLVKWLVKKGWIKEVAKKGAVAVGSTAAAGAAVAKP